ncbi:GIY-YIG nuclease family protein [Salinispirillum marinum]|uniref:GIY-YIG nuclease family protein n=2 Tax=Saccharospirillaceae TaxID=255527 RepID=A0ABV8BBW7_9GAMM
MHKKHSKIKVESSWMVYIVRCGDGNLYTGVTTDVTRRVRQHNGELVGGARYTRVRRPVSLLYAEPSADRASACRREYQIKQLSREEKLALAAEAINQ